MRRWKARTSPLRSVAPWPWHGALNGPEAPSTTFGGVEAPFLSCSDPAVFKAFFNRTRADLEEMVALGSLDLDEVAVALGEFLGDDDERIGRLRSLVR